MNILIVSGDVGGARAVIPVAKRLFANKVSFILADNGIIDKEAMWEWPRVHIASEDTKNSAEDILRRHNVGLLIFTTSVKDVLPLTVARAARAYGVPVICLLDNWMNYRYRLEADGLPALYPDVYAVMDKLAYDEAVADGIPGSILRITGQPALASLGEEWQAVRKLDRKKMLNDLGIPEEKRLVAFLSEPVEQDSGSGPNDKRFRGYTEKTVLRQLCRQMQPFAEEVYLALVRHPRQAKDDLAASWEDCKGSLSGGVIDFKSGRDAILISDGVAGMSSILLYEAWLVGKPVVSLLPGLLDNNLAFMAKKEGSYLATDEAGLKSSVSDWFRHVRTSSGCGDINPELKLHSGAVSRILEIGEGLMKERQGV